MTKKDKNIKRLYDKFGNMHGEKVIELVDQLDDTPYGPRYLANPVQSPSLILHP